VQWCADFPRYVRKNPHEENGAHRGAAGNNAATQ